MRKALISGILVAGMFLASAAPAQAKLGRTLYGRQGVWTLGGELDFNVDFSKQYAPEKVETWSSAYQVDVFPEVGYIFLKGFEATFGPRLGYASDSDKNTTTLYGGTLSTWYHYQMVGTLFVSSGVRFSMAVGKHEVSNLEQDLLVWQVGPRVGVTLAFGGKFGGFFRLAVKYDFGGNDITTGTNTSRQWLMDLGLISSLGLFF